MQRPDKFEMSNDSTPLSPGACVIRKAAEADAPAVEALYRELVSDPNIRVLPEQVAAIAASPTSFLLVVESEARLTPLRF
jgi:hypothetical protein